MSEKLKNYLYDVIDKMEEKDIDLFIVFVRLEDKRKLLKTTIAANPDVLQQFTEWCRRENISIP